MRQLTPIRYSLHVEYQTNEYQDNFFSSKYVKDQIWWVSKQSNAKVQLYITDMLRNEVLWQFNWLEYHIFTKNVSSTFRPITFCPLISQMLCSVRSPFLAAELSFTIEVIFPFLKIKPTCPVLSLCVVIVRSKGLEEKCLYFNTIKFTDVLLNHCPQ